MVGILVHGNNHFILPGPSPDEATALALVGHWSIVQIGEAKSSLFGQWQIGSKEFRENLEWAVIVRKSIGSKSWRERTQKVGNRDKRSSPSGLDYCRPIIGTSPGCAVCFISPVSA
jgi:hypothetical protein